MSLPSKADRPRRKQLEDYRSISLEAGDDFAMELCDFADEILTEKEDHTHVHREEQRRSSERLEKALSTEDDSIVWYEHCGCDYHGDHAGCDASCEDLGCDPEASNVEMKNG